MNKSPILCVLAALAAFGQAQTPLTITQSAGSATGELRMQERRTNGREYAGFRAPESITSNIVWTLPSADGTSGQALTTDGAGVLSWSAASSQWTTSGTSIYYNGGPVGIGENTPAKGLLSVYGSNGSAYAPFNIVASSRFRTAANSAILLGTTSPNTSGWTRGIYWSYLSDDLAFSRFKDDQTSAPIVDVYIATDGKVGIGTTTPSEVLTVTGNVDIIGAGNLRIAGTTAINSSREASFAGLTLNTGAVNGYVLQSNGSGVGSWAAVPACSTCVVQGGNTLGAALTIGTNDAQALQLETDAVARWQVTSAGMLAPATTDTYDVGNLTGPLRVRGLYGKIVDTALAGGTGDYLQTRKIQLFDNTGSSTGASYWDLNVVMSGVGAGQNSYFYLRDNGGNTVWRADKIASGGAVATTTIYTDLLPDSTANVRDLGKTTQRWDEINGASLDLTGAANITGNLSAAIINATGSPAYRVAGTTVINASREATFAGLTIATGASNGYVWTSDASGVGSWQAAAGAALPVVDTTGIAKGSSDATKIVRFEVDGLTTGTTRVLTVPDANMTLAGTDRAQTFTAAQTYNSTVAYASTISSGVSPTSSLAYDFGSSSLRWATAYVGGVNASVASSFAGNVTISGGSSLIMDRAARNTNQQFYWGVAGNVATTGAWAVGLVPSGAVSTFVIAHNGTATTTVSEGGQWDFAGVVTTGGALTVTGAATANRFNGTNTNPFQVSGTTIVDSSRNATFVGLTTSGAVSLAGSTISAGSTFSSDLIATTNATYALGSSGVRWLGYLSTLNVSSTFTFNGTLTGDIIPTTSAVYVLGSSGALWNNIHADTVTVYTSLLPDASASANLGGSTRRWTKTWTGDLDVTGTVTPPSGTAFSGTKTVRASGGASDCTLTFSAGIMTGGTC